MSQYDPILDGAAFAEVWERVRARDREAAEVRPGYEDDDGDMHDDEEGM